MIESVMTYNEARQAAFRRRMIEARLCGAGVEEGRRLREALETRTPLVEVLIPGYGWSC